MSGKVVILEVDSCHIRGGYAGDHSPRFEVSFPKLCESYVQVLEAFRHIFFNVLLAKPKDCNVLLIEDTLVRQVQQNHIVTALLRDIQVNSVSIQSKFYMAMIASGLSAGIIVHMGVESSYCFGFADRRPLVPTLQWNDFTKSPIDSETLDTDELAHQLLDCLKSCNADIRQSIARGIVFCGRGSRVSGLSEEVCNKATQIAITDEHFEPSLSKVVQKLPDQRFKAVVIPFNSALLSWVGGSLFASLPSNQKSFLKMNQLKKSEEDKGESLLVAPDSMSLLNTTW